MGGTGGTLLGSSGSSSAAGAGATPSQPVIDTDWCVTALDAAVQQFSGFVAAYTNPGSIPRSATLEGEVRFVGPGDWTSGFVSGSLWTLYEYTGEPAWKAYAENWSAAIENQKLNSGHHDIGFVINNSFGHGYRLEPNEAYKDVIVTAAATLSTRFNETVGAIRSWDSPPWAYPVIVDNMMNLELLFHASKLASPLATRPRLGKTATFCCGTASVTILRTARSTSPSTTPTTTISKPCCAAASFSLGAAIAGYAPVGGGAAGVRAVRVRVDSSQSCGRSCARV